MTDIKNEIIETALKFIESKEMSDCMRSENYLQVQDVIFIIMSSRAALEDKLSAIRFVIEKLKQIEGPCDGWETWSILKGIERCESIQIIYEYALSEISENNPTGTVFCLSCYKNKLDPSYVKRTIKYLSPFSIRYELFTNYDKAKNYLIRCIDNTKDYHGEEYDEVLNGIFYTIEKWRPLENGTMRLILTWYLNHDGTILFTYINDEPELNENYKRSIEIINNDYYMNVSSPRVPYKVGDIITIDRRPNCQIYHAVIAEIGNQHDCMGIQVVYYNKGELIISSLLYSLVECNWYHRTFSVSGLHRLALFIGKLPDPEALLMKISNDFKTNASLGKYGNIEKYLNDINNNMLNLLPDGAAVGDIIHIKCICGNDNQHQEAFALIAEINHDSNDAVIICTDALKLWKTTLKNTLGTIAKYIIKKYTDEEFNEIYIPYVLKKIYNELKQNPALLKDEKFAEKLASMNNYPIIPEAHKKYNLLPMGTKYGGDTIEHPHFMRDDIEKLLPVGKNTIPYPYFHGYNEYFEHIDACISEYGMTDGELNELGKMIVEFKTQVKEMNVKENWSVLRYIGESIDAGGMFGYTHGRYYYMTNKKSYLKGDDFYVIDNEEYCSCQIFNFLSKGIWEIVEDPTGMAARMLSGNK